MFQFIADYFNVRRHARGNILFTRHTKKGQYFWGRGKEAKGILREARRQLNEQVMAKYKKKPIHKARFGGLFVDEEYANAVYECLMHDCGFFMANQTQFGVMIDT